MTDIVRHDATLYVDGELIPSGRYSAATQCIALLAAYCGECSLDIVLVTSKAVLDISALTHIPSSSFIGISTSSMKDVPSAIQDCQLPAVYTHDQISVYSGLCTVLRYIVKRVSKLLPSDGIDSPIKLLGHRLYCLKACSEVSARTKLCEILMPSMVDEWGPTEPNREGSEIPEAIKSFEHLMSQPIVIHNRNKRERAIKRKMNVSDNGIITGVMKQVARTKDVPQLEHVFTEGVDFSLTDLCLFPCINFYLEHCKIFFKDLRHQIPLTLKWYCRVLGIPKFRKAASLCAMSFIPIPKPNCIAVQKEENDQQIPKLKQHDNLQEVKNKEYNLTIKRDLPTLLQKLIENDISVIFSTFKPEEITIDWLHLPKEVHPTEGELSALRATRKCHQIENILMGVKQIVSAGDRIVDFCSGGGHVGIVLAHMFPDCRVVLVENKEESLERARSRIDKLKLPNIVVYQCNLEFYKGTFDIGVALHACGVASDMVIQTCISKNASFVVSPCCYGKVRNCHWIKYPQSIRYSTIPVSFEENLLLGRAADQTCWDFNSKRSKEGKLCMGYVDLDRAYAAGENGYTVQLYTMQPQMCSPKNSIILGKANKRQQT